MHKREKLKEKGWKRSGGADDGEEKVKGRWKHMLRMQSGGGGCGEIEDKRKSNTQKKGKGVENKNRHERRYVEIKLYFCIRGIQK